VISRDLWLAHWRNSKMTAHLLEEPLDIKAENSLPAARPSRR
jgi:hypothetical protein